VSARSSCSRPLWLFPAAHVPTLLLPNCLVLHPISTPCLAPTHSCAVSLFGLYLLLKFLPDLNIQSLLNAYFWLLGSIAMLGAFGPTLRTMVSRIVIGG